MSKLSETKCCSLRQYVIFLVLKKANVKIINIHTQIECNHTIEKDAF